MTYAQMIDLESSARVCGESETDTVRQALDDAFEGWLKVKLETNGIKETTDEEYEALRNAFFEGFGIDKSAIL